MQYDLNTKKKSCRCDKGDRDAHSCCWIFVHHLSCSWHPRASVLGNSGPMQSVGTGQCRGGLFGCCVLCTHRRVGACWDWASGGVSWFSCSLSQRYLQGGMCLPWSGAGTAPSPLRICTLLHFSSLLSCLCLLFCTHCKVNVFTPSLKCCLLILQENHIIKGLVWTAVIPAGFHNLLSKSAPMSLVSLHVYGSVRTHTHNSKLSVDLYMILKFISPYFSR